MNSFLDLNLLQKFTKSVDIVPLDLIKYINDFYRMNIIYFAVKCYSFFMNEVFPLLKYSGCAVLISNLIILSVIKAVLCFVSISMMLSHLLT